VSAPGSEGQLGILPRHASLVTVLTTGELRIVYDDAEEPLWIGGGFLEVHNDTVTILANSAEYAEEIDQARAEEACRHAQEHLAQAQTKAERAEHQAALERAASRLRVAELARRRGRRRIAISGSQ
jgi:F-type H+-transporting ATPase subunit epsilon